MKSLRFILVLIVLGIVVFSCSKNDDENNNQPCESTLKVNLGNDTTLYEVYSYMLDAGNSGSTYLWSTGETTQTIEVTESGEYSVEVTDQCSETKSDNIIITFCYTVELDLGNDTIITDGNSYGIDAGNKGAQYLWSTGETSQVIIITEPGTYWVDVTSCDSEGSDTIIVDFNFSTIKIETDFGDFRIWLYFETPLHKANFLDLTRAEYYNDLIFHRVVEDFVIQGGDPDGTGYGDPGYTIPAEIVPGLSHIYGAVGAARQSTSMESNGSQFYIVSDPDGETGLDGDYTVFGIVFDGIETVYDISLVPVDGNQKPIDDVFMNQVVIELFTVQELEDNFGFVIP